MALGDLVLHEVDSEPARQDIARFESRSFSLRQSFQALEASGAQGDSPDVFLSRLSANWIPRILTVSEGGNLIGLVYAKERKVLGIATGLVYLESVLGSSICAQPQLARRVLNAGLSILAAHPQVKGLRLVTPNGAGDLDLAIPIARQFRLDVVSSTLTHHAVLPLASTYEEFLARLHHNTRHNFRRSRNRSELAGHRFAAEIPLSEFEEGIWDLHKEKVFGAELVKLRLALSTYRAAPRPLLMGLRADDGRWLSLMGGWFDGDRAIVNLQMNNDQRFPKFSLSLVARSHAIERLISEGRRQMIFYGSVSEPLSHYTQPIRMTRVYLDKRDMYWRLLRSLTYRLRRVLKGWPSRMAEWIVPFEE